eukprot:1143517-Pelagomonas_calceolata.AAC.12
MSRECYIHPRFLQVLDDAIMFKIRQYVIDSMSTFLHVKCLRSHPLRAEEEYIIGKVSLCLCPPSFPLRCGRASEGRDPLIIVGKVSLFCSSLLFPYELRKG